MAKQSVSTKKTTTSTRVSFNMGKALSILAGTSSKKGASGNAKTSKRCPTCGKFMGGGSKR